MRALDMSLKWREITAGNLSLSIDHNIQVSLSAPLPALVHIDAARTTYKIDHCYSLLPVCHKKPSTDHGVNVIAQPTSILWGFRMIILNCTKRSIL